MEVVEGEGCRAVCRLLCAGGDAERVGHVGCGTDLHGLVGAGELGPVVNSTNRTGSSASGDSLSLYISVTKTGGFGANDIWVSQRATTSDAWGVPVNLGTTINTAATEFVPAFSEDGHRMFFASDRAAGPAGRTSTSPTAPTSRRLRLADAHQSRAG